MALKFLNKKGWHTGSLRNIENVWKAEQKHDAEQKKLEELRKQIHEERERSEFRLLQEQAGLVPKQERLDFFYDSGLAVGKKISEGGGFKALEALPSTNSAAEPSTSAAADSKQPAAVPGALFEEKPQSANDTWRKLHSDPLLLIRQREQEALARVKNNPIQMAAIRKSVEVKKHKEKARETKEEQKKHRRSKSKHLKHPSSNQQSDSENDSPDEESRRKSGTRMSSHIKEYNHKAQPESEDESSDRDNRSKKYPKHQKHSSSKVQSNSDYDTSEGDRKRKSVNNKNSRYDEHYHKTSRHESSSTYQHEPEYKRRNNGPKLSEEECARRLHEMQVDAELHEEQRWKRLKKAEDDDAREATRAGLSGGKNFLQDAHKSVYGAEKGGSSTIEESVRRRTHYSQRTSTAGEGNAFRML